MKQDPNLVYAYAGGIISEEYQQNLQKAAQDMGLEAQVQYLGMVKPGEELNQLYNAAEATIQASEYESFSLVKIESLAAGVPVLLQEGGPVSFCDGCVAYRDDNFDSVLQQQILEDKTSQGNLQKISRESAVNFYGWGKVAKDYLNHFSA